jgi:5-methylcytosine-specific restriction endonuclease McrA
MPIALLVGFVLLLTVAAQTWVKRRRRGQRLASRRDEYRKSDAWQQKRAMVLKRDKYHCVYCGARASRVHTKHYASRNVGSEPIEWLVSVCERCHRKLDPDLE